MAAHNNHSINSKFNPNCTKMDNEETKNLLKWLQNIPLSWRTGNIARDFSDGVMMAELIKCYYPQHVDLHNYSPVSKRALKVENWSTLNKKVLSKLDLRISDTMIEKIASATEGAILHPLTQIRLKCLKNLNTGEAEGGPLNSIVCNGYTDSGEKTLIPVRTLSEEGTTNEKIDYLELLKKKDEELSEKDEILSNLTQKVSHLESQLELKDKQIEELRSILDWQSVDLNSITL